MQHLTSDYVRLRSSLLYSHDAGVEMLSVDKVDSPAIVMICAPVLFGIPGQTGEMMSMKITLASAFTADEIELQ